MVWHNHVVAAKKVSVSAHVRKGKAVKQHVRTVENTQKKNGSSNPQKPIGSPTEEHHENSENSTVAGIHFTQKTLENLNFEKITRIKNCSFKNVELKNIKMRDVEFSGCSFQETRFVKLELDRVQFVECDFNNSLFEDSKLRIVSFDSSEFFRSNFNNSELSLSVFKSCDLDQVNFCVERNKESPTLFATKFLKTTLAGSSFDRVHIDGGTFIDCEFDYSSFHVSDVYSTRFENCTADHLTFEDTRVMGAEFESSHFYECFWSETEFQGVLFKDSSIKETYLRDVELIDCEFDNLSIRDTDVKGVVYAEYTFSDAQQKLGVTEKQFEFLVLSGAIEVRDNKTLRRVTSGFDPRLHHVPPWVHLKK